MTGRDEEMLAKLARLLEQNGQPGDLSAAEIKRLRSMIEAYEMFLQTGKMGRLFVLAVISLAAFIAASVKLLEYWTAWGTPK